MSKPKVSIIAGPVLGATRTGRAKWDWRVEKSGADGDGAEMVSNHAQAARMLKELILAHVQAGFVTYGRIVDQTGAGAAAVYHPDGRVTDFQHLTAADGLIGPRCFALPITATERKRRASAVRRIPSSEEPKPKSKPQPSRKPKPKPKPERKPRAEQRPKPKPERKPKPKPASRPKPAPKPSRPTTPSTPPLVAEYLTAATSAEAGADWIRSHAPVYLAQVVRWVNANGTSVQKSRLVSARALAKAGAAKPSSGKTSKPTSKPASKPTSTSVKPKPKPQARPKPARTPKPKPKPKPTPRAPEAIPAVVAEFLALDPARAEGWFSDLTGAERTKLVRWVTAKGTSASKALLESLRTGGPGGTQGPSREHPVVAPVVSRGPSREPSRVSARPVSARPVSARPVSGRGMLEPEEAPVPPAPAAPTADPLLAQLMEMGQKLADKLAKV